MGNAQRRENDTGVGNVAGGTVRASQKRKQRAVHAHFAQFFEAVFWPFQIQLNEILKLFMVHGPEDQLSLSHAVLSLG